MKMLVFILNDEDKVDEVLLSLSKAGIKSATVLDSVGMGGILGIKLPFFKNQDNLVQIKKPDNKTIFTVTNDDDLLRCAIEMLRKEFLIEKPGTGFLFVVPVLEAYGTAEILNNNE